MIHRLNELYIHAPEESQILPSSEHIPAAHQVAC